MGVGGACGAYQRRGDALCYVGCEDVRVEGICHAQSSVKGVLLCGGAGLGHRLCRGHSKVSKTGPCVRTGAC